ncbi:Non-catalytic module family DOC2, partial [Piromyces sp. E2]
SQGYKCCSDKKCRVYYTDSDGNWGYESDWCGCNNTPQSCGNLKGYPCCKTNKKVAFTDEDGDWSVENGDWCLIKN